MTPSERRKMVLDLLEHFDFWDDSAIRQYAYDTYKAELKASLDDEVLYLWEEEFGKHADL